MTRPLSTIPAKKQTGIQHVLVQYIKLGKAKENLLIF